MEIKKTQAGDHILLSLEGRLDTLTAPKLQAALTETFPDAVVIELDFEQVEYVSSAGLRVLLLGEKTTKAAGKSIVFKNVSAEIMEVFEITGFTGILNII